MLSKRSYRKDLLCKRNNLEDDFITMASHKIFKNLRDKNLLVNKSKILIYLPVQNEVDTTPIIREIDHDKYLFLPAFVNGTWLISKFNSSPLVKVFGDIKQPSEITTFKAENLDAAIVPGVGFTLSGVRLGFGLGVYDRLLAGTACVKIGLCYNFQIAEILPAGKNDVKMDYVVSESGVFST